MGKNPDKPPARIPIPVVQPKLASHVQAAISRGAQPKAAPVAGAPGVRPQLAAHVRAAIGPRVNRPEPRQQPPSVQAKPGPRMPGNQVPPHRAPPAPPSPAPRRAVPPAPPRPRASVAQMAGRYKSVSADQDFNVTASSSGGKHYFSVTALNSTNELANMRYKFYSDKSVIMEHVEAYGMPNGTRTGYLLFYLMAKHAKEAGMTTVYIGTGVDQHSVQRNLDQAQEDNNLDGIAEGNRNMAAVHIYTALGFNAANAVTLSNSSMPVDDVISRSRAKIGDNWLKKAEDKGCFLTTACTQARGLPDDCHELEVLRAFRDRIVATGPAGAALVEEYYQVAPAILSAISRREDREEILDSLYRKIRQAVAAIEAGDTGEALEIYALEVARLLRDSEHGPRPQVARLEPVAEEGGFAGGPGLAGFVAG